MRNMEKNLKIRMRLLIVFLITILIALALTFLSIRQTIKIQRDYTSILSGPIAITYAVQSSETEINSIARQLRDMALSGYDTSIMDEIQASVDSIEKSISTIQTLYTDSDGVAQTYIQSIHEWENAFEDIHTALQADNLEEARRLIETQCTPKLNQAVSDGNTLIREVQNDLDAQIDSTQASVSRSQIVLFIMAILVVAIGILLNLRAIRNITRPLQEAQQAVVAFSQGDLSVELTYEASNEIGTICDAVRTSQDILGRVIEDIVQITKGLADGDLTVENIICRTDVENPDKAWYIIDPNTGNLHDSPYLDYGKLLQSLHGGYEFMMMTPRCTVQENHIDFQLTRSAAYDTLFEAVCDDLRARCGAAGLHSILAHELIHWLRLMPYKLNKDKKRAPMFYAGLVMVANDLNTWENEGKFDEKARTDRR